MNTFLIAILSSFLVFQNEIPAPDSLSAKVDTAFLLGYRANRGDADAIALLESCKKPTTIPLTGEKNKAEVVSRLKEMRVQPANLRSGSAPVQEIPIKESFSPSGALTYNIPIATIAGHTFSCSS